MSISIRQFGTESSYVGFTVLLRNENSRKTIYLSDEMKYTEHKYTHTQPIVAYNILVVGGKPSLPVLLPGT